MNFFNKKEVIRFLVLVTMGIVLCVVLFVFFGDGFTRRQALPQLLPDVITTHATSLGNIVIENKTGGYVVTIPSGWHPEQNSGSGLAVYSGGTAADEPCKIEISELHNTSHQDLGAWLTGYMHTDPTAEVKEFFRERFTIGDSPAILWTGILNGESSTLAYVATGTAVYEFAPSVIAASGSGATAGPTCVDALKKILTTFQLLP